MTAQSHYRAMALLTGDQTYGEDLRRRPSSSRTSPSFTCAIPDRTAFVDELQAANDRFTEMSNQVTALDVAGERAQAIKMHIDFEHTRRTCSRTR